MQRDPRASLWDVREAALAIQSFTAGMEAAALAARIPDLPGIVAFRNQLIHGYATVNVSTVWNVAQTAKTQPGRLTPSPKALQKALVQSAKQAQRMADAFGLIVPSIKPKQTGTARHTG